jgi:hypothetical protein
MNGTSVAEHDGHFFLADLTVFLAVGDNHGECFSSSVKFSALIYPMSMEKASPLPESVPQGRRKQSAMKTAPNQRFKTCTHGSSEKIKHP